MKVIYIAGKYNDPRGAYWIKENIRDAELCALFVWELGGVALCPHKNTALFDGALNEPDPSVWIEGDLELLRRCDAIWLIPGWMDSKGANVEREFAEKMGLPVLYSHNDVREYLA